MSDCRYNPVLAASSIRNAILFLREAEGLTPPDSPHCETISTAIDALRGAEVALANHQANA